MDSNSEKAKSYTKTQSLQAGRRYSQMLSLNLLKKTDRRVNTSYDSIDNESENVKSNYLDELKKHSSRYDMEMKKYLEHRKNIVDKSFSDKMFKRASLCSKFIYLIISNTINIFAVSIYIIQTFTDNELSTYYNPSATESLNTVEVAVTLFFLFDFLYELYSNRAKLWKKLFSWPSFIDVVTIFPSLISFFYVRAKISVNYIRIFRVFRVFRILRVYKSIQKVQNENINITDDDMVNRIDPIKLQFFSILIVIFCTIFIASGIVLSLEDIFENEFSMEGMNFFDAFYYMITSLTTIGTGDLVPTGVVARMIVIFALLIFITIVTNQFNKLGHLLKVWGDGLYEYSSENHYIIVSKTFDEARLVIEHIRSYKEKTPILVLSQEKVDFISKEFPYNKVKNMKTTKIDSEVLEYANSKMAIGVFLLCERTLWDFLVAEKRLEYTHLKVRNFHKSNNIPVFTENLVTDRNNNNETERRRKSQKTEGCSISLNKSVAIIASKTKLIAKSCFVAGFSTFMHNLVFNRYHLNKVVGSFPAISKFYHEGTANRIVTMRIPEYFIGKAFVNSCIAIYYKSISDYFSMTNSTVSNSVKPAIMIGVVEYTYDALEKLKIYPFSQKIKANSIGVFITSLKNKELEEILGLFKRKKTIKIVNEENEIDKQSSFTRPPGEENDRRPSWSRLRRQSRFMTSTQRKKVNLQEIIYNKNIEEDSIVESSQVDIENIRDIKEIKDSKEEKRRLRKVTLENLDLLRTYRNNQDESFTEQIERLATKYYPMKTEEAEEETNQATIDDRNINLEKNSLEGVIANHFIIVGFQAGVFSLIEALLSHFPKQQIYVTSHEYSEEKVLKMLKRYSQVRFVKGNPQDPSFFVRCSIKTCKEVILVPSSIDEGKNEDIMNILSFRALDYFFDVKVKIEIWDAKNLNLIGYSPLDVSGVFSNNEFAHPKFVSGDAIIGNHFKKLVVTASQNPLEFGVWNELLSLGLNQEDTPPQLVDGILKRVFPVVLSLDVPSMYFQEEYNNLTHDLLKLDIPAIPLGIYIENPLKYLELRTQGSIRGGTQMNMQDISIKLSQKRKLYSKKTEYLREKPIIDIIKRMKKINKFDKVVLDNVDVRYPHLPVFITNPPPGFPLERDLKVMVLALKQEVIQENRASLAPTQRGTAMYNKKMVELVKSQNSFATTLKVLKEKYDTECKAVSKSLTSMIR